MRSVVQIGNTARASALWGKGGRRLVACTLLTLIGIALAAPLASAAGAGKDTSALIPSSLLAEIQAAPDGTFDVIVQGDGSQKSDKLAESVAKDLAQNDGLKGQDKKQFTASSARDFQSIDGIEATLTGRQIQKLLKSKGLLAITPNVPVVLINPGRLTVSSGVFSAASSGSARFGWASKQLWPTSIGATWWWQQPQSSPALTTPTIAVVDSGIDASRNDLQGRIVAAANLVDPSRPNTFPGDGYGHGTFVASIAAGSASGYAGAAPNANLLSVDVVDDNGYAQTSDVIDAVDWIIRHKDAYNIRVANLSLQSALQSSFMYDPLDRAVERLWQAGVVVVASAGNYAVNGQQSGVLFAPGNDPFVITVGAADERRTSDASDDVAAPWSSYGYTPDGFAKPELGAPGRYLLGAVPPSSTLARTRSGNLVSTGYMQLSGTSFSAAETSGVVADLLALHPSWSPDQVKGALMLGATNLAQAARQSLGVGEINLQAAAAVAAPPNPNAALDRFLTPDPNGGGLVFDTASWSSAARASAAWSSASWSSAAWSSASWSSAAWSSAAWSSAAWSSAAWSSAAWSSGSQTDIDNAATDGLGLG